ncbi:hypothetical protein BD779DRAFT_1475711 [Infundibulicybe gibba]|nr:hypothetical protein BD779DRAFT_1475711 [Infundibulicybe gibba]
MLCTYLRNTPTLREILANAPAHCITHWTSRRLERAPSRDTTENGYGNVMTHDREHVGSIGVHINARFNMAKAEKECGAAGSTVTLGHRHAFGVVRSSVPPHEQSSDRVKYHPSQHVGSGNAISQVYKMPLAFGIEPDYIEDRSGAKELQKDRSENVNEDATFH